MAMRRVAGLVLLVVGVFAGLAGLALIGWTVGGSPPDPAPGLGARYAHLVDDTATPGGYDRGEFGSGWADLDGDCLDTREEMLHSESRVAPTVEDCTVVDGEWVGYLTGEPLFDRGDVDIDHVVSLSDAWQSGANEWTRAERVEFANDLENLGVSWDSENRRKSDRTPAGYTAPYRDCGWVVRWAETKRAWGLRIARADFVRVEACVAVPATTD
jgi:hypothetical protein